MRGRGRPGGGGAGEARQVNRGLMRARRGDAALPGGEHTTCYFPPCCAHTCGAAGRLAVFPHPPLLYLNSVNCSNLCVQLRAGTKPRSTRTTASTTACVLPARPMYRRSAPPCASRTMGRCEGRGSVNRVRGGARVSACTCLPPHVYRMCTVCVSRYQHGNVLCSACCCVAASDPHVFLSPMPSFPPP